MLGRPGATFFDHSHDGHGRGGIFLVFWGSQRCWRVGFQPDRKNSMRIPTATYRVQFNRAFKFCDAKAIVPYLHDLGISDCYASPVLKTPADSDNGYDVCDPSQLNPVLGSE